MQLERTEARVLGALIEKEYTTPEVYPLTLKALHAACNQKSNRDPVLDLREFEIEGCILGLRHKGLARVVDRAGSRTPRYSQHIVEELRISKQEAALLAELLLRGNQAAGELHRRARRMARFESPDQVEALLRDLAERRFVRLLPRETGQRHPRWTQLLCADLGASGDADDADEPAQPTPGATAAYTPAAQNRSAPTVVAHPAASTAPPSLQEQLAALRDEVAALRARVDALESGDTSPAQNTQLG